MILFAVGLIALVGILALAIDTGFLLAERRQNQAAADSAAMAAAKAMLDKHGKPSITDAFIRESGRDYGSRNSGVDKDQVDVDLGTDTVRVTVRKDVQKFFLGAIYDGPWTIENTAVARIEPVPKPYALVALSHCPAAGIKLNGSVKIRIDGGGSILSNCNVTNTASGGSSSLVVVGGSIDAAGPNIESNSSWIAPDGMNTGMNPADDPLKDVQKPPRPTTDKEVPACLTDSSSICYMDPGRYSNKTLQIRQQTTVCMRPGIYYLDEGTRLSLHNHTSTLTNKPSACPALAAGGVLIFVTGTGTAFVPTSGNVILSTNYQIPSGQSECDASAAPYSGAPCGMVLWIDNGSNFHSQAGGVSLFDGVFYAPRSSVSLQGAPASDSQGVQVIVGTLELGGSGEFNLKYTEYVKLDNPRVFLVE